MLWLPGLSAGRRRRSAGNSGAAGAAARQAHRPAAGRSGCAAGERVGLGLLDQSEQRAERIPVGDDQDALSAVHRRRDGLAPVRQQARPHVAQALGGWGAIRLPGARCQRRGRGGETSLPPDDAVRAIAHARLPPRQALQRPVVAFVQPPALLHRYAVESHGLEDDAQCLRGAPQTRGERDVEFEAGVAQPSGGVFGLAPAVDAQLHVAPAREAPLAVRNALAVAEECETKHGHSASRRWPWSRARSRTPDSDRTTSKNLRAGPGGGCRVAAHIAGSAAYSYQGLVYKADEALRRSLQRRLRCRQES